MPVAAELDERGLIHRVDRARAGARRDGRGVLPVGDDRQRVALVTGTNEEADAINDAIQQRRVDHGELTLGADRARAGGAATPRRRHRADPPQRPARGRREPCAVDDPPHHPGRSSNWSSVGDSGDTRTVSHDYAAEHVQLAYASTVHGIQGETTDASVVGPGVDAAGCTSG